MTTVKRVAIVTGASRGIGKAIAIKLAREGCAVVLAAKTLEADPRLPGSIRDTANEIAALGGTALPVRTNVRQLEDLEALVDQTIGAYGRLDIVVNNAGALWWKPVAETPAKRFDLVMEVNVRAAFVLAQLSIPHLAKQGGHIINLSPSLDLAALPGRVAYLISKFGMTMMVLGLAKEVKHLNIAVNALWPKTIIESQATIHFGLGRREEWRTPEIMADAVAAIVRKSAAELTGQALLDEDVLRGEGVADFSHYACVPGGKPRELSWDLPTVG